MHTAKIAAFEGEERDLARLVQQWQFACYVTRSQPQVMNTCRRSRPTNTCGSSKKIIANGERGAVFLCVCLRKLTTQLAAERAASCKRYINYVILVLLLRLKNPINLTLLPHINLQLYGCTCFDQAVIFQCSFRVIIRRCQEIHMIIFWHYYNKLKSKKIHFGCD
jgi:hypothetical protein